jgi:serine/threonine protein kinase/Flp pilus assembly protein TadD
MQQRDTPALAPGTRVDQYLICRVLGRGGFGITYLVHDEMLQKDFALKEFFPEDLATRDSTSLRIVSKPSSEGNFRWGLNKFFSEARLLAQLNHANIVSVRRVFEANNSAYMLLDYIDGGTLEDWLRRLDEPPTQQELDVLSAALLSALEFVHAQQMWHLDVSPDNIMIRSRDGAPILVDFGASRLEIKQHSRLVSALIFKSGYSAPEQYTSSSNRYGPWTDIYAFGATLQRAVTGKRPIEATARSLSDDQEPATKAAKGKYRQSFLKAIDWALRVRPNERPQSVAEWSAKLLESSSASVPQKKTGSVVSVGQPHAWHASAARTTIDKVTRVLRPSSQGRPVIAAVALGVLTAALGAAYLMMPARAPAPASQNCTHGYHLLNTIRACSEIIAYDPKNAVAYAYRGRMFIYLSEPEKALADADRAIALNARLPDAFVTRGAVRRLFGEPSDASKDLDQAIRLKSDNPEALILRALVNSAAGNKEQATQDYATAIARLNEALAREPADALLYRTRGSAYANRHEYDTAIADYDRAIKLTNDDPLALSNRGVAYIAKRAYDQAIADLNRSIELNDKFFAAYNSRGYAFAQKGQQDQAIADYTQALALYPRYAPAYRNRGFSYNVKRDYKRAIADFDEAVKLNYRDAAALAGRGYALNELWLLDEAIADLDRAVSLNPDYYYAYNNRGVAWERKKERELAIADYRKAVTLNPNNSFASNRLKLLVAAPAEAKAMLEKAAIELKANEAAALVKFNRADGGFRDRDLYVFCYDMNTGKFTAHVNQSLLGTDVRNLKEQNGSPLGEKVFNATKADTISTIGYSIPKPGTTNPVPKESYVTRVGNQGCGVGYYK